MTQNEKTRSLLASHYKTYPKLEIRDILKFLHQSTFGCEHLVSSSENAAEYIEKEYETVLNMGENKNAEPLDGNYSRVHLSCLDNGLSPQTFAKMFVASAKTEPDGVTRLQEKLDVAKELVKDGILPFDFAGFENEISLWAQKDYPALHHSETFRKEYAPSYRVISNQFVPFLEFFAQLDKRLAKGKVTAAIDGGSASGKTTLSELLSKLYDCTVFHMDDFFLQPHQRTPERFAEIGGNIDRERFLSGVLQPLNMREMVNYRKFDCSTMSLGEEVSVVPKKLTVIEGAYSMHPEFEKNYDFSVFLDIPSGLQKERITKRNSPKLAGRFFDEWIPMENVYFTKTDITKRCDMIITIG